MQSGWGRGWWLGVAGVVAGSWGARHMDGRLGRTALVAATGALAVSLALSGHPAAAPSPSMAIVIDALHVFGAGAWVGGLACLAGVAIPLVVQRADGDGHRLLATLVSSFSPVALGGAALAAVTGGVAAWRNLGSPDALLTSDYGRWLLAKIGAIAVAAALGAYNWKRVGPSLGDASATLKLRRMVTLELSAMLVVVLITAALVASPFPGEVEGTTIP